MASALPQKAVVAPTAALPQSLAAPAFPRQAPHMQLDLAPYAVKPNDPSLDTHNWDRRQDGTLKSTGFLGLLKRPDGKISSEISIGVNIGGKEVEIPTMVPTLSQAELHHLMSTPVHNAVVPHSIVKKAVAFAKQRMAKGMSPFYSPAESQGALP